MASYLRKNAQLLNDAGYTYEVAIKFETWQGLDPALKAITSLKNDELWDEFVNRVRENKPGAHFAWRTS